MKKAEKAKIIFDRKPSIALMVFAVLAMLMSISFISLRFINAPINPQTALSYEGIICEVSSFYGGRSGSLQQITIFLRMEKFIL